jgi:hypothetical protein
MKPRAMDNDTICHCLRRGPCRDRGSAPVQAAPKSRRKRVRNREISRAPIAGVNATDFSDALLWRTEWGKMDPAKLGPVRLEAVTWSPAWRPNGDPIPSTDEVYAELRGSMNNVPEGMRGDALKRIETLDCANPDKALASCDPAAAPPRRVLDWQKNLTQASVDDAAYAKALATELRSLVCESDVNAIYILRGTLGGFLTFIPGVLAHTGRLAPALVDFIMSKDCPVSASLTADDNTKLLKIKQDAEQISGPPTASKKRK